MQLTNSKCKWYTAFQLALLCLLLAACVDDKIEPQDKPNILLIVLDDFGYNDLAINNSSDSPTPRLDDIAIQGTRFTRHYAQSSCTASRVAMLTGRNPAKAGSHPYLNGIDHELVTLPDALEPLGYTRYLIGKWHAGDSHRESRPEYQGFDHWFGFMNQLYLKGPHAPGNYKRAKPTYLNPWLENEGGDLQQHNGHLTDILTDKALEVIESETKPWFMYLSYYAPHTPIEVSARFSNNYTDDDAGRYQALKKQLDSNIGRIIDKLKSSEKLDNTMLIVVSDNGGTARDWPSNLPFYGAKASFTEGGTRTPLLMSWPERWPTGRTSNQIATIMDLYPTILSALGASGPADLDGVNLFPESQRSQALRWYSHGLYGDRYGVLSPDGNWRLSTWQGVAEQLFHENDFRKLQQENHVDREKNRLRKMRNFMEAWIQSATRVKGMTKTMIGDWAHYEGHAFRRTPLGGTHTIGLVFKSNPEKTKGSDPLQLVHQEGYIDISEHSGSLHILIDGHETSVSIPKGEQCFTLVIQSLMLKNNMVFYRDDNPSRTVVSINGVQSTHTTYFNPDLATTSPKAPLRIFAGEGRWFMPSTQNPFISTRFIGDEEVGGALQSELQASCDLAVR
ncbi:MAG: sulfatase-like hydrolase/transferase [Halieaceae bacterium]